MSHNEPTPNAPHLVWVYTESPGDTLDAATWLEITRELRNMGWRVTLVAPGPAGRHSFRGVEVTCIPKPQIYLLRQFAFHAGLLRLVAADWPTIDVILFGEMSALWLLPLRFIRGLTGRRRPPVGHGDPLGGHGDPLGGHGDPPLLVMDTRSLFMSARNSITWKDRLRMVYFKFMAGLANHWADGQTAITPRMAEAARIPSRRLWGTWPSGVNPDQFAPAQIARRWPLAGQPVRLIYVGSLHYERNLMSLCRAVAKANAEGMNFNLALVGDGTERPDLEEYAHGTNRQVCVLPPVPHDQVPELLAGAHIGALPFPDEEKFRVSSPIKLFEYMASGLPILATRVVCHTDIVGVGQYVFWAEDASLEGLLAAMRLIWAARASLGDMGSEAAAASQAWTWQASAMKLEAALEHGGVSPHHRLAALSASEAQIR